MFANTKVLQSPLMFLVAGMLVLSLLTGANMQGTVTSGAGNFAPMAPPVTAQRTENDALILMYHMISDTAPSTAFIITSAAFESDIRALKEAGYTFCKASDLERPPKSPDEKRVAITFDDGYDSDYLIALPILEKYDACATFFVVGSMVGTPGYMTEEQLYLLAQSDAVQVGNHSYSYHRKPFEEVRDLYASNPSVMVADILQNQEHLKNITKRNVTAFSFPYGVYNETVVSALEKQGLTLFCSDERKSQARPFGRFNRPFDLTLQDMIARAEKKK